MSFWWVNQNKTYKHEVGGGYMWSPKKAAGGSTHHSYEAMKRIGQNDIVFSFSGTFIKAIGVALDHASSAERPPEFGVAGDQWDNDGWRIPIRYMEFEKPIKPRDHMETIAPALPEKYFPLRHNGNGVQSYLLPVSDLLAERLVSLIGQEAETFLNSIGAIDEADDVAQKQLQERDDITDTEKLQLVLARRGQGLFRSRLEKIETSCRLTGLTITAHLRASHIKPWRNSTDAEKLDGSNGLLLSPHVDHLFDRGYVTFGEDGEFICSAGLDAKVFSCWHIEYPREKHQFTAKQREYLRFHREHVFETFRAKKKRP